MSLFGDLFRWAERPRPAPKLRPEDVWQLSPDVPCAQFLRTLPLLALADGMVAFEGTIDKQVARWLATNASSTGPAISAGTVWPASDWWFLPINGPRIGELADLLEDAVSPSIHIFVYDDQGLVIEWYDAFDEPLWVTRRVGDVALTRFVEATGGSLEVVQPSV